MNDNSPEFITAIIIAIFVTVVTLLIVRIIKPKPNKVVDKLQNKVVDLDRKGKL